MDQDIKSFRDIEAKVSGLRNQKKNLKKAAKAKNAEQAKELESLRVYDFGSSLGYWAWHVPGHYEVCLVPEL
nr:hypothetical protein [Tanacetum cinerariifolium]